MPPTTPTRFTERSRDALRGELLDAAAELLTGGGWEHLTMAAVAARVGVSRQTVYHELGDKRRLVEALALRETQRFCAGVEAALGAQPSVHAAVRASVRFALGAAQEDPLVKAVVHGDDALLPLVTSRGEPVLLAVRDSLARALDTRFPGHAAADVRLACDAVARLVLSHLVLPLDPPEVVADAVARTAARLLHAPEPTPRRTRR